MNAEGRFVIVWQTPPANGFQDRIFGQRYGSDGAPMGGEFRADTGANDRPETNPAVGMDAAGNFVVGYMTKIFFGVAQYHADIYVQFFNADGTQVGSQVTIADGDDIQENPVIAMAPSGDFVIAYSSLTQYLLPVGVLARRYFKASSSFSGVITVDSGGGFYDPGAPSLVPGVAMRDDGTFVVTWWHFGVDGSDVGIAARLYLPNASPVGSAFTVNTSGAGTQNWASAVFDSRDRFCIVWQSTPSGSSDTDVFAQRFKADGTKDGSQFAVNTFTTGIQSTRTAPTAAVDATGNITITWTSVGQDGDAHGVYADKFFLPAATQDEFRVNTTTTSDQKEPSVASDAAGDFAVVWLDNSSGTAAIRRQHYSANGVRLGLERVVATSAQAAAIGMNATGSSVVVWEAVGGAQPDVAAQRFDPSGAPVGSVIQVTGEVSTQTPQFTPAVAVYADGRFVVVWSGRSSGDTSDDIFGQLFGADGVPITGQFKIDQQPANNSNQYDPDIAILPDGGFIVVWGDGASGSLQATARLYDVNGSTATPRTNEFLVTDTSPTSTRHPASVSVDDSGRIVFVWESEGEGVGGEVFGRRCSADGQTFGPVFQINAPSNGSEKRASVAAATNGYFVAAWCSNKVTANGYDVYLRRFQPGVNLADAPTALGSEAPVNVFNAGEQGFLSAASSGLRGRKKVAMDAYGNYVVVWHSQNQDGGGYGIYATKVTIFTPPTIVTAAPTNVTAISATLAGEVTPNGNATQVRFEYGATTSYGASTTVQMVGNGTTALAVSANVSGLVSGTTYHYRVTATNGLGTTLGGDEMFTTSFLPPTSTTGTSTPSLTGVVLGGSVNPNGVTTTAVFEYGLTTAYGSSIAAGGTLSGRSAVSVSASLAAAALTPGATYHYRLVASNNANGTPNVIAGSDATFTAVKPPVATTANASDITTAGVTLNGTVTPNDYAVAVNFEVAETAEELGTGPATAVGATPASFVKDITAAQAITASNVGGFGLGVTGTSKTYFYRTVVTVVGDGTKILGETRSFTVQNTPPVARDDAFIVLGEATLDPIKQTSAPGTRGQDTDADPGDTLTIKAAPLVAALGIATRTTDQKMISYNPGDLFPNVEEGDSFTYTIQDSRGVEATATVRVFSVRVLAGNFSGLIGADGAGAAAGRLDLTLTRLGQITGSFKWQGQLYSFNQAALSVDGTFTKAVPKDRTNPDAGTLQLTLQLDPVTKILTGTLTDTSTIPATVATAEVTGTATLNDLDIAELPEPGIYSAYIDPGTVGTALAESAPKPGGALLSRGLGFSRIVVKGKTTRKSRPARTAGRMPDDQTFSSGVKGLTHALRAASGQAKYSLFVDNLYQRVRDGSDRLRSGGVVSGDLLFTRSGGRFDSDLNWERLPQPQRAAVSRGHPRTHRRAQRHQVWPASAGKSARGNSERPQSECED